MPSSCAPRQRRAGRRIASGQHAAGSVALRLGIHRCRLRGRACPPSTPPSALPSASASRDAVASGALMATRWTSNRLGVSWVRGSVVRLASDALDEESPPASTPLAALRCDSASIDAVFGAALVRPARRPLRCRRLGIQRCRRLRRLDGDALDEQSPGCFVGAWIRRSPRQRRAGRRIASGQHAAGSVVTRQWALSYRMLRVKPRLS